MPIVRWCYHGCNVQDIDWLSRICLDRGRYMHRRSIQCLTLSGFLLTFVASTTFADEDLLIHEQWALNNVPRTAQNSSALITTANTATIGTCADKPVISGSQYSCSEYNAPGVEDMDINAPEGWSQYSPSPTLAQNEIVIALVDTGIDYTHPDLRDRIWLNPGEATGQDANTNGVDDGCEDNVDGDQNGYLNDCHGINTLVSRVNANGSLNPVAGDPIDGNVGHGTNMAGVMTAASGNLDNPFLGGVVGVAGIEPNIRIATCKSGQLESDVFPLIPGVAIPVASEAAIRQCMQYFHDLKMAGVNIAVVNASGGMSRFINISNVMFALVNQKYWLDTPEMQTLANLMEQDDIVVVAAAGNNGWNIDQNVVERAYFPAAFTNSNIISVGAINNQGELWSGSSYGRWTVDIMAPGQSILSTSPRYPLVDAQHADFVVSDGTSQATAYVTGVVALLRANASTAGLSASAIRRLLLSSGKPLPAATSKTVGGNLVRLADANGRGALSCNNQVFRRRQLPAANAVVALPGETVKIEVQNYNCAYVGTETSLPVTVTPGNTSFQLRDDGVGDDTVAGDGIYSGSWTVPAGEFEYFLATGADSVTGTTDVLNIKAGIIVDNTDSGADYVGKWWASIYRPGFYGSNYRYATEAEPEKLFTWSPLINEPGYYRAYARWPQGPNFATNSKYRVHHQSPQDGTELITEVSMNQTINGNQWRELGLYWFNGGIQSIDLTNVNANGTVIADAIMLVPQL